MAEEQRAETMSHVKKFIKQAPEGFATLVLMGDSTMSGLVTELLNISWEVKDTQEILYVSNDRKTSVRYGCNAECGGVPPGGEWHDEALMTDSVAKTIVERSRASTEALHSKGCNSGGGLETYIFRSGPYKNFVLHHWGFLPEYADYCWKSCMVDAMAALKPTVVVWNTGFHLLNHDFNPSVCRQRSNPTKPLCGDYKSLVKLATHQMLQAGVQTVVWKHTNWVCESRQMDGFPKTKEALLRWGNTTDIPKLEEQCQKDCPQYEGMSCRDWFFNARTSKRMYKEASEGLELVRAQWDQGRVLELDAYNPTRECCDRGCEAETDDGEHYAGLDSELTQQLMRILVEKQ